jgi:ribulose 1,5-bisphosphate synthetase/thiazole synthase
MTYIINESDDFIIEKEKKIKILNKCDVLVVGGGVAGIGAAIAAARSGVRVILVDNHGYLGGTATAGMVNNFGAYKPSLISGVLGEIINKLEEKKSIRSIFNHILNGFTSYYDPEVLKYITTKMLQEAGVKVYLHSYISDAIVIDNCVSGIIFESKSGRNAIISKAIVDSTGDGDVAAFAGADFCKGRESDNKTQAMSLCFRLGNVNFKELIDYVQSNKGEFRELNLDLDKTPPMFAIGGFKSLIKEAIRNNDLKTGHEILWFGSLLNDGEVWVNWTHIINKDGLSVTDLSFAEMEGLEQVFEAIDFFKKYIPGFKDSRLVNIANDIGVRETRRIVGEYILTESDIVEGRIFKDVVVKNNSPMDIHSPDSEKQDWLETNNYDIPYRCLVPIKIDGLLVSGRCISATHKAMASIRFEPCCMATGQAAGVAAALSVKYNVKPRELNVGKLQEELKKQNVIL